MTFYEARQRVNLAGRELGSGGALAADRLVPSLWQQLYGEALTEFERRSPKIQDQFPFDETKETNRAKLIAYGVAVGLVMGENPNAMATLEDITNEWSRNHGR